MMRPSTARAPRVAFAFAVLGALIAPACSQTPVVVPVRSMERPKDVDFVCLLHTADDHWRGAPLSKCQSDDSNNSIESQEYRLHAVITQLSRGELAVVDLARGPADASTTLVKTDPRTLGYSFLPVGAVPSDVAADPNGEAIYVSSGRDRRIDIVPSEMIRGPADTFFESGEDLPWPKIDLSVADGVAGALAVVRDPVIGDRLYATLPDAIPAPKLAVFDLSKGALTPTRLADVTLGAAKPSAQVGAPTPTCATSAGSPWWSTYETCFGGTLPKPTIPAQPSATRNHLAGIAVAAGKLFAADDAAPVVHVFDLATGVEEQQIGVGSATARLAVSEPVPDEVTPANYVAIETCARKGWFGDGLDHSAESAQVRDNLGGRCAAHRYVYAIDLVNAEAGDGSLIVLDVPVVLKRDATGAITKETVDVAATELRQPLYCDSPAFPARRVPVGTYGLGGINGVPVRALSFVKHDPPSIQRVEHGVRCVPWKLKGSYDTNGKLLSQTEFAEPGVVADPVSLRADEQAWAPYVGPTRVRGVHALAALANGTVAILDVDDYDALCRAPKETSDDVSTDELTTGVVARHHPRLARLYTADSRAILNLVLVADGTVLSTDSTSDVGATHPHMLPFETSTGDQVAFSNDGVPAALTTENWSAAFEGQLPAFVGAAGTFGPTEDPTAPGATFFGLLDPAGHFCRRGVEVPSETSPLGNDVIQITEAVCQNGSCATAADRQACLDTYGAADASPLSRSRDLLIGRAFEDRVQIARRGEIFTFTDPTTGASEPRFRWSDASDPTWQASFKKCFPSITRYTVRANGSWLVQGSSSGYLHRRIPSVASDPSALCVDDANKPRIHQGRARELPALASGVAETPIPLATPNDCAVGGTTTPLFQNPAVKFAIRAGTTPSVRDMVFSFQLRNQATPLTLALTTLPTTVKPIARWALGVDQLNWRQVAVIDGIDRGFSLFSLGDLTTSRNYP